MKKVLLLFLFALVFSCDSGKSKKVDSKDDEAENIFAVGLAEAKYNFQIEDDLLYIDEFHASKKISQDSMVSYAIEFRRLVQGNFHFSGVNSLQNIITIRNNFNQLDEKYKLKGFEGICDLKDQYDSFGSSTGESYKNWLKENKLNQEELEKDMIKIQIEFGRICRTKKYKEQEKGMYFDL